MLVTPRNFSRSIIMCVEPTYNFAPHICQYWTKLVYLCLRKQQINEITTLMRIKGIPTLHLLDTIGDITKSNNNDVDSDCSASGVSALRVLYMHCNDSSTLNEILKLCPNLTSLSLYQPKRSTGVPPLYVPVEKSLILLRVCIHKIRALYLTDYTDLTNEDVMALRTTQLHTLSITNAGSLLRDDAILELVPTLPSLHTLALIDCWLTYRLVDQVPPLCLTLRSFTYDC